MAGMNSPNRHHTPGIIVLQSRTLQHRQVMQLAPGCTASKWQREMGTPNPVAREPMVSGHTASQLLSETPPPNT